MTITVFGAMMRDLEQTGNSVCGVKSVSQQDYKTWRQHFSFHALTGQRYGQSFCNVFNITDNILFYERDIKRCEQYIRKTYLT